MKYLLSIYENEKSWASMSEAEVKAIMGEYFTFTNSIETSGNYVARKALQPTDTATTVRIRDGKWLTTLPFNR